MTTTRYKLTSPEHTTHGGYTLPVLPDDGSPSEWFYPARRDEPPRECSDTALHHYAHPLLAVLFNPIHANIADPVLYEIEIDAEAGTDGLKGWCGAQRLVRRLPLPVITTEQRVEFAIRVAMPLTDDPTWHAWAQRWLSGEDRSEAAARGAWGAESAESAALAAELAELAAELSSAGYRTIPARAAVKSARSAAWAAESAAERPDFLAIIREVTGK
jgi:hypothetical protein